MKITVSANQETRKAIIQIKNLNRLNAKGIRSAFYKIGKDLKATSNKLILAKPRFGRTYLIRRNGRIIKHIASRRGEAPANMTGNLRRSLDFNVQGADRLIFGYREGFPANKRTGVVPKGGVTYGKFLENKNILDRPGLLLSIKKNEANAIEHFETELKKRLTK